MADYSFEAGFAREAYGTSSNQYGSDVVASTSLRYGLTERVTLFGHAEGKNDLTMAGFGFAAVPFALGEVTLTFGGSKYQGVHAGFFNGAFRTSVAGFEFSVNSTRSDSGFADLAYITGVDFLGAQQVSNGSLLEFPRALDVFSLSIPISSDHRKLVVSYVNSVRSNSRDEIVSASYGHSVRNGRGSLNLSASHNITADETRLSLGLSLSLGKRRYARTAITRDAQGLTTFSASRSRSMSEKIGDYGYHVQVDTRNRRDNLRARGDYRSRYAEYSLEAQQSDNDTYMRGQMDGARVFSGGTLTAGNTITDSFTTVDVGIEDVPIYLQNREVTRTDASGRTVVPGLSPFRRNRVSINVPIFADVISNNVSVDSGTYSSGFSGASNIELTYGVLSCDLLGATSPVPSFTVAAEVAPSCEIDVTSLDFGVISAAVNAPVDAQATVNVRCTSNTSYTIGMDNGTGPGANSPINRLMQNGPHVLRYGIYRNAGRSRPWGNVPGTSVSGTGQGTNQSYPVYGRINSGQTAHFGVYTDSVVVTVNY